MSRATVTREMVCEGVPALIAVLSDGGAIVHATSGFVDRFDGREGELDLFPVEVELITTGQSDRLTAKVDDLEAGLTAVVDRRGRRMAMVMIAMDREDEDPASASPLFDEPLDDSPAIVWLKDLDGRYLKANRRYLDQLGTSAEKVRGRTDAELTPAESIEGMRLEDKDLAASETLELEYLIGAFEERPAFAALRFALRDRDGQPTATCSVAAPLPEAALARAECDRLMRLDRWQRLDAVAIRQELLEEWGLTLTDGSAGPPRDRDERVAAALAERDDALAAATRLEESLAEEKEQLDSLRAEAAAASRSLVELEHAASAERARAEELDSAIATQRARAEELDDTIATERARADELESTITTQRAHAEELDSIIATQRAHAEELDSTIATERAHADERVAAALAERDDALATAARLEESLAGQKEQLENLRTEVAAAGQSTEELDNTIAAERARADELDKTLAAERARADELDNTIATERARADERVAEALAERDDALATAARLEESLAEEKQQLDNLRTEVAAAGQSTEELDKTISAERARADELDNTIATERARADELDNTIATERARADELDNTIATERARADELDKTLGAERARADELDNTIATERARADELDNTIAIERARADELDNTIATERARADELQRSLVAQEAHLSELETELAAARAEIEDRPRHAELALEDAEPTPEPDEPGWDAAAQHSLSAGFVGLTEWPSALKHAIETLGALGGWDAAIGWSVERPGPMMRCGIVWMRDSTELPSIEARAWKHVEDPSTAEFGRARSRMATTCLLDLQSAEDPLLRAAAGDGAGSAVLVPINDGRDTIAMLELLSRNTATPDPELVVALDAIALQLGALARLFKYTDDREWRLGRL